jgi:hypothetical protein
MAEDSVRPAIRMCQFQEPIPDSISDRGGVVGLWGSPSPSPDRAALRSVVEALQDMKLPASAVEQVACGNYARVLKEALKA